MILLWKIYGEIINIIFFLYIYSIVLFYLSPQKVNKSIMQIITEMLFLIIRSFFHSLYYKYTKFN